MDYDEVRHVLMDYGADPMVLEEYACVVDTARIVGDVVKLRGPYGTFALEKVYMGRERLEYVHQITEHVARSGLLSVPRFIRSRFGDAYVVHPSGLYYLTSWSSGRSPNVRRVEHLCACANLLGRWHHSAAGFYGAPSWYEQAHDNSLVTRLDSGLQALCQLEDTSLETKPVSPFMRLCRAASDSLHERIDLVRLQIRQSALEELEAVARSDGLVCHGAFHKNHLVFDGETHHVRHYDQVHAGVPLYEFALFLHRYMPAYSWRTDILEQLVDAYVAGSGGRFLDRQRLQVLLLMPLRPLQLMEWYVGHMLNWDEADYVDALEWALDLEEQRVLAADELIEADRPTTSLHVPVDFMSGESTEEDIRPVAFVQSESVDTDVSTEDSLKSKDSATKVSTESRRLSRPKRKRKPRLRTGPQTFGPTTPVDEEIDEC